MKYFNITNLLLTIVSVGLINGACDEDLSITKAGDLKYVKGCSVYSGNIVFKKSGIADINLSDIRDLEGDLTISNDKAITSINLSGLKKAGKITISKLENVGSIDLSKLTEATSLEFTDLEKLTQLTFGAGLSKVKNFELSRTQVVNVDGIQVKEAGSITVKANNLLKKIEFANLTSSSGDIIFDSNGKEAVIKAPKLSIVGGKLLYTNSSTFAAPEITEVGDLIHLASCSDTKFDFKKLTKVGSGLTLTNNLKVKEAHFTKLTSLEKGGLLINGNTQLKTLDLSSLEQVAGGFTIDNPSIATLKLNDQLKIEGAANIFANISCTDFRSSHDLGIGNLESCKNSQGDGTKKAEDVNEDDDVGSGSGSKKSKDNSSATFNELSSFALTFVALFLSVLSL